MNTLQAGSGRVAFRIARIEQHTSTQRVLDASSSIIPCIENSISRHAYTSMCALSAVGMLHSLCLRQCVYTIWQGESYWARRRDRGLTRHCVGSVHLLRDEPVDVASAVAQQWCWRHGFSVCSQTLARTQCRRCWSIGISTPAKRVPSQCTEPKAQWRVT